MALAFLRDLQAIDPQTLPRLAAHAAYYAMFHAARAVLVKRDGLGAPTKHAAVVNRFGHLAHLASDDGLAPAAAALRQAQALRLSSDHDVQSRPEPERAVAVAHSACAFLELCARRFGFVTR